MTPDQLAKSGTEHGEQVALFAWANVARLHGFEVAWKFAEVGQAAFLGRPTPSVRGVNALEWLHAIPNGGTRGDDAKSRAIRGGALKAEGVRQGVPDIFLPLPVWTIGTPENIPPVNTPVCWHGLYIEMKKPDLKPKKEGAKGGLSDEQIEFASYAKQVGYGWIVCYTWREAATAIQQYIEWGKQS